MASARDRHHARKAAVAALGRELSRRASSRCELCQASGSLTVVEVPPVPKEPSVDSALMVCGRCAAWADSTDEEDPDAFRFLEAAVWSELRPTQLTAVRWTRRLARAHVPWAREALDGLFLDPEVEALL